VEIIMKILKYYENGDHLKEVHHHKISEYLINPDHKALGSFDSNNMVK
jgi:hypothetical protein